MIIYVTNISYHDNICDKHFVTLTKSRSQLQHFETVDFNINTRNPWYSYYIVTSNLLSNNLLYIESTDRYTSYVGTAELWLKINGKFTMGKLK